MTDTQLGFDVEARAQILDRVLEHTDDMWRASALRAIATLAGRGTVFQAADVLALGVAEPAHPNFWGATFRAASQVGLIEHVGYAPSHRRTVQGSVVKTWRGSLIAVAVDREVDNLRALSVNRTYAGLIIAGIKTVENRSKPTHYRGRLVIHASQRTHRFDEDDPILYKDARVAEMLTTRHHHPTGFIGVVDLVDVCTAALTGTSCGCGPWSMAGHAHWLLADPRPFPRPLAAKGRLGLFPVPLVVADIAHRVSSTAHPEGIPA